MKSRLPKGMGGGPTDMQGMMKQAKKMQDEVARVQAELEGQEFSASSGGGAVQVIMTGKKELQSVKISPEVVDPGDIEILEDMITAAVNEVIRTIDETSASRMEKVTGGLNMPGLF